MADTKPSTLATAQKDATAAAAEASTLWNRVANWAKAHPKGTLIIAAVIVVLVRVL